MKYVLKDSNGSFVKRKPPYYLPPQTSANARKFYSWFAPYVSGKYTVLAPNHAVATADDASTWSSLISIQASIERMKDSIIDAYRVKSKYNKKEVAACKLNAMTFIKSLTIETIGQLEKDGDTVFKGDYVGISVDSHDDTRAACFICKMSLSSIPCFSRPIKASIRNRFTGPKICVFCASEMGKAAEKSLKLLDPAIVDNIIKDRFIRHL